MSMKTVTCLNCNASINAPQSASIIVCPYCGHTFELSTGKTWTYYMFPAYVESPSAWRKAMQFITRRYGVPDDFNAEANLRKAELYNVPYHVFSCKAYSSCSYGDRQASYLETRNTPILAAYTGTWLDNHAKELSFSVRGRSFFNPSQAQRSRFYMPTLSYEEAYNIAYRLISGQAMDEASRSCGGSKRLERVEVNYLGLVHYPFWLMEYAYKGKPYRILLDAAGGRVLFVEYPLSTRSRATMLTASAALAAVGLLTGLLATFFLNNPLGLLGGIVSSIIASSPMLAKAFSIKDKGSETPAHRKWSIEAWRMASSLTRIPVLPGLPVVLDYTDL
ncbi:MAG: hypothetical protein HA496_05570 [Thaumarchaeota archaeon]|nr:hypothetical protein [Nitrososphaerota archaeon]